MPPKTFALASAVVLAVLASTSFPDVYLTTSSRKNTATPAPPHPIANSLHKEDQQKWPNLDVLSNFKHPKGTRCGLDGAARHGSDKAAVNRLKNRYVLPDHFQEMTLQDLLKLPQGHAGNGKFVDALTWKVSNQDKGVSVVGYVVEVVVWGCARAPKQKTTGPVLPPRGVESHNCYTNEPLLCNTQIKVTTEPDSSTEDGRNTFIVEVTERGRRLARMKRLSSSIGTDWSVDALRKLTKKWVRFSGYLFFDDGYKDRAWFVDPDDKIGAENVRETAWEIHPVLGIEADVPSPKGKPNYR